MAISATNTRLMLNKVPQVTLIFWIIKVMSTTVGETGADYLAVHVGLGALITDGVMLALLIVALLLQLRTRQYVPWRYWVTVVLVSVVGTQITDFLTDKLDISLYLSTAVFTVILAAVFAIWYGAERRSRSIRSSRGGASCSTGRPSCSPSRSVRLPAIWRRKASRWASTWVS